MGGKIVLYGDQLEIKGTPLKPGDVPVPHVDCIRKAPRALPNLPGDGKVEAGSIPAM
jgi:hypothetical protein